VGFVCCEKLQRMSTRCEVEQEFVWMEGAHPLLLQELFGDGDLTPSHVCLHSNFNCAPKLTSLPT
jgi:hypothetical protein